MLNGFTITPAHGDPLTFPLPGGGDGYLVKRIEGLDPVPVSVSSNQLALLDREVFKGSRREKRNIVITFKMDQNYAGSSIHARRMRLYSLGMSKAVHRLTFETSHVGEVYIDGYVESIESDIYSDDTQLTMSFICLDPSFKSTDTFEVEGEFGTDILIEYGGSVEVGFRIIMDPIPSGNNPENPKLTFQYEQTSETVGYIYAPASFTTGGNSWEISTIPGRKHFQRIVQGDSWFSVVDHDNLIWPVLHPGTTRLITSASGLGSRTWPYTIRWREGYGAI